jgi:hypothetical protein
VLSNYDSDLEKEIIQFRDKEHLHCEAENFFISEHILKFKIDKLKDE